MDGFNALADELRRNTTTEIEVTGDEPPDLPLAVVADLLAIAREALANVARHADAGHATLALSSADGALRLEIADDGRGLGRQMPTSSRGHHGLANMRARAARPGRNPGHRERSRRRDPYHRGHSQAGIREEEPSDA